MSYLTLQAEIEAIIKRMKGCTYMRANPNEANLALDKLKVKDCLCIHIDRTDIQGVKSLHGSYVYKYVPTEILFVYKNHSIDEKQSAIDILCDQAEQKADEFFDKIIQSSVINDIAPLDDYTLGRLQAYKRFDATLSGVLFTCNLPIHRNTYYCA